jgi:hypothetical protein
LAQAGVEVWGFLNEIEGQAQRFLQFLHNLRRFFAQPAPVDLNSGMFASKTINMIKNQPLPCLYGWRDWQPQTPHCQHVDLKPYPLTPVLLNITGKLILS